MFYTEHDLERRSGAVRNPEDLDERSEFGKDRDRVLYCEEFRMLAGKTQVVAAGERGVYHNRLTHTLKVAQLGRRAAELLRSKYLRSRIEDIAELAHPDMLLPPDPDLVEAACLAHDLGHPPFGHAGEEELSAAMDRDLRVKLDEFSKREGQATLPDDAIERERKELNEEVESLGFEGNAQTFRILTFLAVRNRTGGQLRHGLDLTRASLDATIKYPRLRTGIDQPKWGAYGGDREAFEWVRQDAPEGVRSFEAHLMDWCDEVAYAVHDVTDCFRTGLIPLDALRFDGEKPTPEATRFFERSLRPQPRERLVSLSDEQLMRNWDAVRKHFVWIEEPYRSTTEHDAVLSRLEATLFEYFMNGISWRGKFPCRYDGEFVVDDNDEIAEEKRVRCAILQELPWHYVIHGHGLQTLQHGQRRVVRDLFRAHVGPGCRELYPPDRWEDWNLHHTPLRAAADHISSLDEAGAEALFARLSGIRLGALTDSV